MTSKTVHIESTTQFSNLLSSSAIVIADFYADWCGPCQQIAPVYEQLSEQLSRPNKITFAKINTDRQQELAQAYGVRAMPTFMIFKNARKVDGIEGADPRRLSAAIKNVAEEASKIDAGAEDAAGSSSDWLGATLPRGFEDVTSHVDVLGLELLNWDSSKGGPRVLFAKSKPKENDEKDYVQSDTDEQLMMYIPFQSTLKIHSLHITSVPKDTDDDENPSRPKVLKIFTNKPQTLSFDDADSMQATQDVTIEEKDWDTQTHTAKVELRFVKFQNISSLVVFVAESEGDNEKVRIDRVRVIGESGEKRDGKIEKISQDE